ncbi:MAG: DUF4442 domain-containing protein [Pseudomonadales bacterium]|nr:DUF4442 domain-containing protein [Pseudomonadales bacterium]
MLMSSLPQRFFSWAHQVLASRETTGRVALLRRRIALKAVNRVVGLSVPFVRRNHFQVLALHHGYLKAWIPVQGNRNHMGTIYAGALFMLAEVPGGVMALFEWGTDYVPVLKEMTMHYLKPATSDVTVEFRLSDEEMLRIQTIAKAQGKCEFTLQADLVDAKGVVVAKSEAHYQIRTRASLLL